MRSFYALHLSLSVAIPAIQPRLRLSRTNRLRSTFHGSLANVTLFVLYYHAVSVMNLLIYILLPHLRMPFL
ncbi:MAG: hypothetical protein KZQ71_13275 [Candidatus Thiodiazotropha sp. (ex Lucinoma aequizonata)]|nr:hypothetical protein [Candidatus Thiodiazotropha sp. (ex Lucinoma aequizonata)]MCU7909473.1 hypothetical protein [Candidatus Thiodiazotropha sp. (ex Lucinoma aequizonata)]